jgi:GT2 family glycosyltransferase
MGEPALQQKDGSSTAPSLPASSLILCSRNRPKLLFECVSSILQGEELPTELLIIDDSDSRHERLSSLTTARGCEVRYLWTHSVGLSRANNDGIAAARYNVLVFTQDDALVSPTWFGAIVRALIEAGQSSVVTGQVLPSEPETSGAFAPSTTADLIPAVYEGRINKDVLFIQNMAMYRFMVEQVGYFDPGLGPGTPFPAAEDNDFGLRLLEAGYRILYVPQAIVYHRAWRAKFDYIPLQWNYGRGQGAYYAKYLSLRDRYMLQRIIRDMLFYLSRVPRRVWHIQPYQLLGDTAFVLGILSGATEWLWTKRRIQ